MSMCKDDEVGKSLVYLRNNEGQGSWSAERERGGSREMKGYDPEGPFNLW